jgi:hypothetical protein
MGDFIGANPGLLGLFIGAIGALILVGAILNWNWIVGTDRGRVRTGLLGYIVYKLFGRRVFFMLTGGVVMIAGIVWFVAFSFM